MVHYCLLVLATWAALGSLVTYGVVTLWAYYKYTIKLLVQGWVDFNLSEMSLVDLLHDHSITILCDFTPIIGQWPHCRGWIGSTVLLLYSYRSPGNLWPDMCQCNMCHHLGPYVTGCVLSWNRIKDYELSSGLNHCRSAFSKLFHPSSVFV